ncbi:MAG: MOSC domain-containing protein [Chloroflexi bacterium]|nr:MOSC domain-containing protein [Chloroflexota bacterium]
MQGTIASLQICTAHRAPMEFKTQARALANRGLEGDRHAQPNGSRQVLLMDEETLNKLGLPPGNVKENITTRGIAIQTLAKGTRVKIGDAVFEITKPCTPCERMDEIRNGLRTEIEGQRGILAKVIEGGTLRVGDAIEVM